MMYGYIMQRTQISLTREDRNLLDQEAARTGRSISALIREAVTKTYGPQSDASADLQALDRAFGAWSARSFDGERYVDELRSGSRLDWDR